MVGDGWHPKDGAKAPTRIQGPIHFTDGAYLGHLNVLGDVIMDSTARGETLQDHGMEWVCIEGGDLIMRGPQEKAPNCAHVRVAGGRIRKERAPIAEAGDMHDYVDKPTWIDVRVKDYRGTLPAFDLDFRYAQGWTFLQCGAEHVGGLALRLRGEARGPVTLDTFYYENACYAMPQKPLAGMLIEPSGSERPPRNGVFIRGGHLGWGAVHTPYAVELRGMVADAVRFPITPLTGCPQGVVTRT